MEKIVIGAPYEIIIEPSIDIGEFDSELVMTLSDFRIGVELKKIKGEKNSYSFMIPSDLKNVLKKSELDYCICVYKENARFEVDSGKLTFIDEKDFKVRVKNNAKMRKIEDDSEEGKEDKKKEDKTKKPKDVEPTPTPSKVEENLNPEDIAQRLIDKQGSVEPVIDEFDVTIKNVSSPPVQKIEPSRNVSTHEHNLKEILESVEKRKQEQERKRRINENIKKAIKKT